MTALPQFDDNLALESPASEPPRSGTHPAPDRTAPASLLTADEVMPVLAERHGPGTYDRKKSPEERWDEQKKKLLVAAAHVFSRDGYANASVASILEHSGLSRGTFYRHFRDLGDVFLTVREEASKLLYEAIEARIKDEHDPPTMLRAGITTFLQLLAEHGDLARVFLREGRAMGQGRGAAVRQQAILHFVALIRSGLGVALERGLLSRLPGEITVYALVVAMEGVAVRYVEAHEEARAVEAAPELIDLCFRSFR